MTQDLFAHGFQKWEARFSTMTAKDWAFGDQPTPEVQTGVEFYRQHFGETPALAVDLGAGDGRNTLFLAAQGFRVRAIEGSPTGAKHLQEHLDQAGLTAEVENADLRSYSLPQEIDLLVASYIIHLLPEPYRVLREWMNHVRAGGFAVIATRGRFEHDPDFYWFPQRFELKHIFQNKGWRIFHFYEQETYHPEYNLFRRTAVVAQKPE